MEEINPSNKPAEGQKAEAPSTAEPTRPAVRKERERFRALILGNPNYFGNVKDSPFKSVEEISQNVEFEELECLGFNTQLNQLEAVVWIKQDLGYGGDICSPGTSEYVRFYVDWDNSGNFVDQGLTSFTVYDIPGDKPLEYAVMLQISPVEDFCFIENLPNVRAILSWNNPPPPNTPGFIPVWGNVLEGRIQIDAFQFIIFSKLLEEAKVKLPDQFANVLDLSQPIPAAKPKALSLAERQALYKDKDIPGHRFAFTEVQQLIVNPALTPSIMAPGFKGFLSELNVNLAELIEELLETDGDTTFEELTCVGLNPNLAILEGTLTIKLPNGYSGDLCTAGSQEYVAFWIDYGSGFNYVGTVSVNVHDISTIPAGGLQYAVFLPVNFSSQQQPCQDGPKIANLRAILSWELPPPPGNPDFVPTWGNRLETLILVTPGTAEGNTPFIESVGNVAVCDIDQTTGLARVGLTVCDNTTIQERPFGSTINITGFILNPPNVIAGAQPFKYKVSVQQLDLAGLPIGPEQALNNTFTITITETIGGSTTQYDQLQSIDADGYYTYWEQSYPNQWRFVQDRLLAQWLTGAPMTGLWRIKLEAKLPDNTILSAGSIFCPIDGTFRSTVNVLLDEVIPTAHIHITGFVRNGVQQSATDCATFQVGDLIQGSYSTFDEHFGQLTLTIEPASHANGATVNPDCRVYPTVPTTGETNTWSLDTTNMDPCGYTVQLHVEDRTIVGSGFVGWQNDDFVGFCLEAAPQTIP